MKKHDIHTALVAAAALTAATLCACQTTDVPRDEPVAQAQEAEPPKGIQPEEDPQDEAPPEQAPRQRTFSDIEHAQDEAGFTLLYPESIGDLRAGAFSAAKNGSIAVGYLSLSGRQGALVQKSATEPDIPYERFSEQSTVIIGGQQVTSLGAGGKVHYAAWSDGDYWYHVQSDDGISLRQLYEVVEQVS